MPAKFINGILSGNKRKKTKWIVLCNYAKLEHHIEWKMSHRKIPIPYIVKKTQN